MKKVEIKTKNKYQDYSIIIGGDILGQLKGRIKKNCPKAKKIGLIIDKNVPKKFVSLIKKKLNDFKIYEYYFNPSEKLKSFESAKKIIENFLSKNLNRSDIVIGLGGGIVGDISSFVASVLKRGVNFISLPTTLLSQVDSSIGGKTGVNSKLGKNLIGTFYQPKLVFIDVRFLMSLPKRQMICGYAEILKHAIIRDKKFFTWLSKNSDKILNSREQESLIKSIKKSCKIKLNVVNKDLNENNLRMILNFGHTFAHAIELKNGYKKNINHGEAVLFGIILAAKLSNKLKICSKDTVNKILSIYKKNELNFDLKKYFSKTEILKLPRCMVSDKKNHDDKINFILLKKIGMPTKPNSFRLPLKKVESFFEEII